MCKTSGIVVTTRKVTLTDMIMILPSGTAKDAAPVVWHASLLISQLVTRGCSFAGSVGARLASMC